jgi:hypothetical protein
MTFEMVDPQGEALKVGFDGIKKSEFRWARVTLDMGLLAYHDLDEALDSLTWPLKFLMTPGVEGIRHKLG